MVRQINFIPRRQCRGRRNLSARKILHRRPRPDALALCSADFPLPDVIFSYSLTCAP